MGVLDRPCDLWKRALAGQQISRNFATPGGIGRGSLLSGRGGIELGAGIDVTTVAPEQVAAELRDA